MEVLWHSKERFFAPLSFREYLRVAPYDLRGDACFAEVLIGKPFFLERG